MTHIIYEAYLHVLYCPLYKILKTIRLVFFLVLIKKSVNEYVTKRMDNSMRAGKDEHIGRQLVYCY